MSTTIRTDTIRHGSIITTGLASAVSPAGKSSDVLIGVYQARRTFPDGTHRTYPLGSV